MIFPNLLLKLSRIMAVSALAMTAQTASTYASPATIEAATHQIDVIFYNVQVETGMIWASLCTEAQYEKLGEEPCEMSARIAAKNGAALSFTDVPPGVYAISAYHDSNDNEMLDFDTRGIPFEPTGNSGNAKGFFGPPSFKQMKFHLNGSSDEAAKTISIKLSAINIP